MIDGGCILEEKESEENKLQKLRDLTVLSNRGQIFSPIKWRFRSAGLSFKSRMPVDDNDCRHLLLATEALLST